MSNAEQSSQQSSETMDFRPQAKSLCASVSDLQHELLVKHTAALLSVIHDQITQRDAEIERLKKTLGTLINWLHRELGTKAAQELLEMLEARV